MTVPDGQPLSRILRGQPLPPGTVVAWGLQISQALQLVHESGQLHRDIKPANIWVNREGMVRLSDSTLPSMLCRTAAADSGNVPAWMGAPQYMSPEQVRAEPLDPRSDIFSLGVVLYEMATGKRPFSGASSDEIMEDILRAQPIPPNVMAPDLPDGLEKVILKALDPDRELRHQSMQAVVQDLEQVAESIQKGRTRQRGRRITDRPFPQSSVGRLVGITLTAAALFALTAGAIWLWLRPGPDPATLVIYPMEARGQPEGAEYLGRSFAEAVAVNLAQAPSLRVLPVPRADELDDSGSMARAEAAREVGAGRILTGAVARDGKTVSATLSLIDSVENRLLWGTRMEAPDGELSQLASSVARRVADELGARFPKLYDYVGNLTGGAAMAASPETSEALGAIRRGEIANLLQATTHLVQEFPGEPDARALRVHALMLAWDADRSPENRRRLGEGLDALDQADPQNPYGSFYRAHLLAEDGESRLALQRFSEILKRNDLTPAVRAWILRYRAYVNSVAIDDRTAALADLEQALRLDPASARTFNILSDTLLGLGRAEEAVTRARQAVALMPSYWRNHETLGLALSDLKRWEEARDAFATACRLGNAQSSCALYAVNLFRCGQKEKAREMAEKTAKLTEDMTGLYNLACYWALADDTKRSLRLLKRAVALGVPASWIGEDSDLAALRPNPEFQLLLDQARRRMAQRPTSP